MYSIRQSNPINLCLYFFLQSSIAIKLKGDFRVLVCNKSKSINHQPRVLLRMKSSNRYDPIIANQGHRILILWNSHRVMDHYSFLFRSKMEEISSTLRLKNKCIYILTCDISYLPKQTGILTVIRITSFGIKDFSTVFPAYQQRKIRSLKIVIYSDIRFQ